MGIFIIVSYYNDSLRTTIINECVNRLEQFQNAALPATTTPTTTTTPVTVIPLITTQDLQNTCSSALNNGRIAFIVSLCFSLLINLCTSLFYLFCEFTHS